MESTVTWWRKVAHDLLLLWPLRDTLRNHLTCPRCGKIGTWKPRGGIIRPDTESSSKCGGYVNLTKLRWQGPMSLRSAKRLPGYIARRWLCKWCGFYDGQGEIENMAFVNDDKKVWSFASDIPESIEKWTPNDRFDVDPWNG